MQILALLLLMPFVGKAQKPLRFGQKILEKAHQNSSFSAPSEGIITTCQSQTKPAYIEVISQEIMQVNGTIQGQAWLWATDTLTLNAPITFKLPTGWLGSATLPRTNFIDGDSLQFSFTLTYPTNDLPFYPQEFTIELPTGEDNYIAEAVGKVYFTPYNTVELWDKTDFYDQKRVWHISNPDIAVTRAYIPRTLIPTSDLSPADTVGGVYLEDVETRLVTIPGLAYSIALKATPYPEGVYDDGLDSLVYLPGDTIVANESVRNKGLRLPRFFSRRFSGRICGRLVSPIVNDMTRQWNIPLSGILIKLKEKDIFTDEVFAETHTDAEGNFCLEYNIEQSFMEGREIELYLDIKAKNQHYDIRCVGGTLINQLDNVYQEKIDLGSQGQNFIPLRRDYEVGHRAFRVVNWAVRGWEYTQNVGGFLLHKDLRIDLVKKSSNFFGWSLFGVYNFVKPRIRIEGNDADREFVMYHELGHFIMLNLQNRNFIADAGKEHMMSEENTLGVAWTEGWASALAYIFDAAHHWEDQEYGCLRGSNRSQEERPRFDGVQRGFFSEGFIACAIYDLWDGYAKQLPPTIINPTSTVTGIETIGVNDFTDLNRPIELPINRVDWLDDVEFTFQDILTPIVQRSGATNKIENIMEYFYQFRNRVISDANFQAKANLARAFEANQINNIKFELSRNINIMPTGNDRIPSGSLSGDAISVNHTETANGQTYTTQVNPNWLAYFTQTRVIEVLPFTMTSTGLAHNPFIFEDLSVEGLPTVAPSRVILTNGNSNTNAYTICRNTKILFKFANLELGGTFGLGYGLNVDMFGASFVDMNQGSKLVMKQNSKIIVRSGATLRMVANSTLQMLENTEIIVEAGGYICIDRNAILNLHPTAKITLQDGAHLGINPILGIPLLSNCNTRFNDAVYSIRMPYIELMDTNNALAVGTGNFTWEFKVRFVGSGDRTIVSNRTNTSNGYIFGIKSGKPYLKIGNAPSIDFVPLNPSFEGLNVADGLCHHIAVRRKNGLVYFYVDGAWVGNGSSPSTGSIEGANPWLMNDRLILLDILNGVPTAPSFSGWLGEARFWNTAISDQDIMAFHNQELDNNVSNLIAYYMFEESRLDQRVLDKMGNIQGWLGNSTLEDSYDPKRERITDVGCTQNLAFGVPIEEPVFTQTIQSQEPVCYPNPFHKDIILDIPADFGKRVLVQLLNAQGNMVESYSLPTTGTHTLHIRHDLPAGLYFIRLVSERKSVILRIIKK